MEPLDRSYATYYWILSWPWNVGQRPLEIIENGTIWKLEYGFLFAFHSNYGRIFSHFGDIQKNDLTLKSGFGVVQGHWKWRGSIDHVLYDFSFCWSAIVTIALSCTVFELFDVE